jgi:hypothetical protein
MEKAVRLFDAIVADQASGYRAAAAYSAARATFIRGRLEEGAQRIDRIVSDPSLSEFAWPAYDLISKLRYQSQAVALNVAELAEIGHMLAAPTEAVCKSELGERLRRKFGAEVPQLAAANYGDVPSNYISGRQIAGTIMAKRDPVIDLAAVLNRNSYLPNGEYGYGQREDAWVTPRPAMTVAHARDRWKVTRNPLWAVALAETTSDPGDFDEIMAALPMLRSWPNLRKSAQARYAWRIVAQLVRIRLMRGQSGDVVSVASLLTAEEKNFAHGDAVPRDIAEAADVILGSGIRWYIKHDGYEAARGWALSASGAFGLAIPNELKPVLARTVDELYGDPVLGLDRIDGTAELGNARVIFNLFSSRQLIGFSRRPEMATDDRRAIVGAAWSRAYALGHWDDVMAWLPDLAAAFPELHGEVRGIAGAWFRSTQRHRATLLLLKSPGIVYLPSWSRPPGGPDRYTVSGGARKSDFRKFDDDNPSDGNWWCAPDSVEIRDFAVISYVEMAIQQMWFPFESPGRKYPGIDTMIAQYPLLKSADMSELAALDGVGSAAQRLSQDTADWADSTSWFDRLFGRDKSLPEALARSVAATRYGCRRPADNGPWSRAAYERFHNRYPDSEWAKRTRYWFGIVTGGQ